MRVQGHAARRGGRDAPRQYLEKVGPASTSATSTRRACPAVRSSASPSPVRCAWSPRCSCSTSRPVALDPELIGEVLQVMEELAHEGTTMIVVTHEMHFAREAADRVVFMEDGVIVEQGPPEQVLRRAPQEATNRFLRRFLDRLARAPFLRPVDLGARQARGLVGGADVPLGRLQRGRHVRRLAALALDQPA